MYWFQKIMEIVNVLYTVFWLKLLSLNFKEYLYNKYVYVF